MDLELHTRAGASAVADILRFHAAVCAVCHDFAVEAGALQRSVDTAAQCLVASADLQGSGVPIETMNSDHFLARLDQRHSALLVEAVRCDVQNLVTVFFETPQRIKIVVISGDGICEFGCEKFDPAAMWRDNCYLAALGVARGYAIIDVFPFFPAEFFEVPVFILARHCFLPLTPPSVP